MKTNESSSVEARLSYLRGRLEAQAEVAKALGLFQIELAERMGSVFADPEAIRELLGLSDRVRNLRENSSATTQGKRRALALDDGAPAPAARKDHTNSRSVKRKNPWAGMSKRERAAEMARRLAKRKNPDPQTRKMIKTMRAQARGKEKPLSGQRLYAARSAARKHGEPVPPLPAAAA